MIGMINLDWLALAISSESVERQSLSLKRCRLPPPLVNRQAE